MKRSVSLLILVAGSLGTPVMAVQSRPDFSGTWTGPAGSLTIRQNETTLTISEGADVRPFNLDGSESRFAQGDTQYTARTRWVGSALVVSITTASPIGTWEDLEVYSLDYGPTLTVVHVGTQTRRPMMFTQTRTYERVALQQDTTVVLGHVERDVTGDGRTEVLRVVGRGPTIDSLDAEFTIESAGTTAYRFTLNTLSRSVGFDAGRRAISAEEHRLRLKDFGRWFFGEQKFQRPAEFVDSLRESAPGRIPEIPAVISRDRQDSDTRAGSVIWEEILDSSATIFTFSPGGDAIVAIGWSARAGRFYRLLECC